MKLKDTCSLEERLWIILDSLLKSRFIGHEFEQTGETEGQRSLACCIPWGHKELDMAGIPVELFQILKDDAVKVLHSICQHIWKTQQRPQDWKRSVFIPLPKKDNAKECSNYRTIALISHASKVVLKILQARL